MIRNMFFENGRIAGLLCCAVLSKLLLALYQVATAQITLLAFSGLDTGTWDPALLGILLALGVCYGLVLYASLWIGKVIKNRLELEISMSAIHGHVAGRLRQVTLGEATVRLTRDAAIASSYFDDYLMPLTEFVLTCGCAVAFIGMQSRLMALLYAAMGLVYYLTANRFYRRTVEYAEAFKTHQDAFMTYFQETIRALPLIRAFRCASWRKSGFDLSVGEQRRDFQLLTDANAKNESFLFAGIYFAEFATLSAGLLLTVSASFSMAQLLSVWSLGINTILYQCLMIPGVLAHSVDIKTSFRRLEDQLARAKSADSSSDDPDASEARTEAAEHDGAGVSGVPGVSNIEGRIGFHYPKEARWLFRDLSLSISTGSVTWITGPNGSGKSTLTQLFMQEIEPSEGQIDYLGEDGERLPGARFAFVPEEHVFFRMSLRENLTLGRDIPDERLLRALRAMGLSEEKGAGRELLDKTMFEELRFSEGQLRRLSILRASLVPVDFIVYDEPFSDLDHESQERVMTMIRGSLGSVGAIIISHTYDLMRPGDRVIRLGGADYE